MNENDSLIPLTPEVIARVERFHAEFGAARMEAARDIPGNPFGVEMRTFGASVATKVASPLLRGKNRILGFHPADAPLLPEMLAWFRADNLPCSLSVPYGQMTPPLFRQLTDAGMWSGGSGTVPVASPRPTPALPTDLTIRPSEAPEKELYLRLFREAFAGRDEENPEYAPFQWAEDSLRGAVRYVAEIGGVPVGMASFIVRGGVGFLGTAGVLPAFRGRGVQRALIERRLSDAPALSANLIVAGGSPFTTTYRNFERAGFLRIPLGMGWAIKL
jgi:GNAT superfamily N-acetyltransferase